MRVMTVAILLFAVRADAQVAVDVVHGFPSTGAVQPAAPLLRASNGKFYGTTQFGGARNAGTVFSLTPDGVFTSLHDFNGADGANPIASLVQAANGYLYGTTLNGGSGIGSPRDADGYGTIFRMALDGTFTSVHSFTGLDGASPSGALIQAADGNFYGETAVGPNGDLPGTVFRMTTSGAVTAIHTFHLNDSMGSFPQNGLLEDVDGFYGSTPSGAWGGSCAAIFHVTAAGAFEILHRFGVPFPAPCFSLDRVVGPLVHGPGGYIFGATPTSVFVLAGPGGFTTVYSVDPHEPANYIVGGLLLGADGSLYGPSVSGVFKLGQAGFSQVHSFSAREGSELNSLIQAPDGNFYGTARAGGDFGFGTAFRMTPAGEVTVLHHFSAGTEGARSVASLTQASDGSLYGTTAYGGLFNGGVIFRVSTAGDMSVVHAFEPIDGITAANPRTPVMQANDGDFYGTTFGGAFRLTPGGAKTTFALPFSWYPTAASLLQANDGQLYGTTFGDGFGIKGTVFRMTPDGLFSTQHSFDGMEAGAPAAELIQGLDGLLYGTGAAGGAFDLGAIFKMSLDGDLTPLYSFAGVADGTHPAAPLVQAQDGQIYGTTASGGNADAGTVFKITPSGAYTQLHTFAGGSGGARPAGNLVQADDGNFYGTTENGGVFDLGTIFRITPAGGFLVVHSFGGDDGAHPHAGLIRTTDGNLYGTTEFGGPLSDGGVVYRVTLPPCTDTLMPTYGAGTLNLGFSLASSTPATFSTWLVHQNGVVNLWSVPVPAIGPAVSFNVPIAAFPAIGNIGFLTVLNAPSWPGACYDWQVVDTGGAGASADALRNQLTRKGLIPTPRR